MSPSIGYCNYVIYMPALQKVKFGITGRLKDRLREIGREASRLGECRMEWIAIEAPRGIARITETELRRHWKPWRSTGRLEWLVGGALDFEYIAGQTSRIQDQIELVLGFRHAH